MMPHKYLVLTAVFFFVTNHLIGFIKNRFIESDEIANDLLTKIRLSFIPILLFLIFGSISNSKLGDTFFSGKGEFNVFVAAILLSTVLCSLSLLGMVCFSFEILSTKHQKDDTEIEE